MITDINIIKTEYNLRDFAMFRLCPMMYKLSVMHPEQTPMSNEQRRLQCEAEILSDTFLRLVNNVEKNNKVYYKGTSLLLTDIVESFTDCMRTRFKNDPQINEYDVKLVTNGLFDKAERIVADINRWVKGSKFTIRRGVQKNYPVKGFTFKYKCSYRSVDVEKGGFRSIYIDEYKDFPVFSAGTNNRNLVHYADITEALKSDDKSIDRVGLAMKIIRKINIQIETGYYEQDGIDRIEALGRELQSYDFEHACKKAGEFCDYCKYFDKCRQLL